MAKKKVNQKSLKSVIYLVLALVALLLTLFAVRTGLIFNSQAATPKCFKGIYIRSGDHKCYEMMTNCGNKCCNKVVDNSKCRNSKYNKPELKCKGEGYQSIYVGPGKLDYSCYLINGKVCKSGGIDSKSGKPIEETEYCCNKQVDKKFCGL